MCLYVCIYIYIYIHICYACRLRSGAGFLRAIFRGKLLHTRSPKHEQSLEHISEIHWTIPVQLNWTSDNPLGNTADKWSSVLKCHWTSIGKCHWIKHIQYLYIYIYMYIWRRIHDYFWGVDVWCAICCPSSCKLLVFQTHPPKQVFQYLSEEFTRLAETRLAQSKLIII